MIKHSWDIDERYLQIIQEEQNLFIDNKFNVVNMPREQAKEMVKELHELFSHEEFHEVFCHKAETTGG